MKTKNKYLFLAVLSWILALICWFFMGCAGYQSWNTPTKIMFTGLVAGQVIDCLETNYILDHDGNERNPLFDGHQGRIIPIKAVFLIGSYYFVDYLKPENRKYFLIPANLITWGVVAYNYQVYRDVK